jgi:hypothetical protein
VQIELDDVNWADLKELSDLRRADRKAVNAATVFEGDPETGRPIIRASMDDDRIDAIAIHVITNWSLPFPLPSVDKASLDKLTLPQGDALEAALKPYMDAITGKNAPAKSNDTPTPVSAS